MSTGKEMKQNEQKASKRKNRRIKRNKQNIMQKDIMMMINQKYQILNMTC